MSAIKRSVRSTSTSGAEGVSELWRGYVVEVFEDGTASVVVPRLSGDDPVGRIPSLVPNLAIDARVIVGAIEGRIEDLVVMSAISADGVVVGDARFTDVLIDNAPTDAAHATRKDYVDAQIVTRALASHTHSLSTMTGQLSFSQLPAFIEIGNAVDANTYVTDGIWHQSQNAEAVTGTNWPIALAGLLVVRVFSSFVYQTFYVYNSGRVYNRTRYNSTWYPWNAGAWTSELVSVTSSVNGFMLAADKVKLDGATAAATNNALVMRSSTGTIQVSAPSVGGDATNKTYVDAQIATRSASGHVHSFAEITGVIGTAQLPPLAVNDVFTAADQAAMLALTAQRGDMAIRTDTGKSYALSSDSPGTLADWKELMATGQVVSVAGKTGVVLITKADVGLSAVDNTSDLSKPISTATQTALNGKANSSHTHVSADITDLRVAALSGKPVTDTPPTYPLGFSYMTVATDGTWPTSYGVVMTVRSATTRSWQQLVEKTSGRTWTRGEGDSNVWGSWLESSSVGHTHSGADITSGTISDARIANATAVLDGLLPKADKAFLDTQTSSVVNNSLAKRGTDGGIQFFRVVSTDTGTPSAAHLVRKDHVDSLLAADHTFPKLRLTATGDVSATSTGHAFQIGPDSGVNLVMDGNEIMARNNGVAGTVFSDGGWTSGKMPVGATEVTRKDYVDSRTKYNVTDCGTVTIAITTTEYFKTYALTFNETFTTVPNVQVTITSNVAARAAQLNVYAYSMTTTGCTIKIMTNDVAQIGTNYNINVDWLAIGK